MTSTLAVLSEFLTQALSVDHWTLFIITVLSIWAGYLIKETLSSSMMASIFMPGFIIGGLAMRQLFINLEFFVSNDNDIDLLISTGAGLIASLIIMTIIARLCALTIGVQAPRQDRRAPDSSIGDGWR